jgi:hypothetical protein
MLEMYPLKTAKRVHALKALIHEMADNRDADEIAAFLKVRGVRGVPILDSSDPIAKYVRTSMGLSPERVSGKLISPVEVSGTSIRCTIDGLTVEIPHLPQIRDFIYRFDRGYYPELFPTHEAHRKVIRYIKALVIAGGLKERIPDD